MQCQVFNDVYTVSWKRQCNLIKIHKKQKRRQNMHKQEKTKITRLNEMK